jgi:hypothetical protein
MAEDEVAGGGPAVGHSPVGLPPVRALEMTRFAGFRAFSLLQMDALNLLASALVAHLHFLKSGADVFGRTWSVICLWLASHLSSFFGCGVFRS